MFLSIDLPKMRYVSVGHPAGLLTSSSTDGTCFFSALEILSSLVKLVPIIPFVETVLVEIRQNDESCPIPWPEGYSTG